MRRALPLRGADGTAGRATRLWSGRTDRDRGAPAPGFARLRDCVSGHEMKSDQKGGGAGQPGRGRFNRAAGRTGLRRFRVCGSRRTSAAGLSSRSPW